MPDAADNSAKPPEQLVTCPACQHQIPPGKEFCPECNYPIGLNARAPNAKTTHLKRKPITVPYHPREAGHLPDNGTVILQLLPSGTCITLSLKVPLTLGRNAPPDTPTILDLAGFNALKHGVSREHCRLERTGERIFVTDIGSANGTYLNHSPLLPHRAYVLSHGDQLVLGSLHMFIAFSIPDEQDS